MKRQSIILIYFTIFIAIINLLSIFFNWIDLRISAGIDLNFFNYSTNLDTTLKTIKGIHLPGGIIGIFFIVLYIVLILKNKKIVYLVGVAAAINAIGYAMGWFVNKTNLLSYEILKDYASAKIITEPLLFLYIYLLTAIMLAILPFLIFKNKQ